MTSVGQKECRSEAGIKLIYRKVIDRLLMHLLMFDICNILLASSLNCLLQRRRDSLYKRHLQLGKKKVLRAFFLTLFYTFFCRAILLRGGLDL